MAVLTMESWVWAFNLLLYVERERIKKNVTPTPPTNLDFQIVRTRKSSVS